MVNRSPSATPGIRRLAAVLREARLEAGLSQRGLARRLGMSWVTVREAESGRDVRRSTLMSYRAALPSLTPHGLLLDGVSRPREWTRGDWEASVERTGFLARAVVVEAATSTQRMRLSVTRMRVADGDLREGTLLHALLRCTWAGVADARPVAADLVSRHGPLAVVTEDATGRHEVRLPRGWGLRGFDYFADVLIDEVQAWHLRQSDVPMRHFVTIDLPWPVEMLILRCPVADVGAQPPRPRAWLGTLSLGEPGEDVTDALHPGALVRRRAGAFEWRVNRPMPGMRYALGWPLEAEGLAPTARGTVRRDSLAARLRRGRLVSGASLGDIARRTGLSRMTIGGAEAGRDLRWSTLRLLLDSDLGLLPQHLLGGLDVEQPGQAGRWDWHADLFGVASDRTRVALAILDDGSLDATLDMIGIRVLRPGSADVILRKGMFRGTIRCVSGGLAHVTVEGDDGDMRVTAAVSARPLAGPIQRIRIPTDVARRGVSLRFQLTAPATPDGELPVRSWTAQPVPPTKELLLCVTVAERWWEEVRSKARHEAWPAPLFPTAGVTGRGLGDVSATLEAGSIDVRVSDRKREVRMRVRKPLYGLSHGLYWRAAAPAIR